MIDFLMIRGAVIGGLYAAMALPVIPADETAEQPPYPFISYTVTSPYLDPYGAHAVQNEFRQSELHETREKTAEIVFSFTVHDPDSDVAMTLAYRMLDFFQVDASDVLVPDQIVVAGVSSVQNRNVFLTIEYERRVGLDVRFRVIDRAERIVPYIETFIVKEG